MFTGRPEDQPNDVSSDSGESWTKSKEAKEAMENGESDDDEGDDMDVESEDELEGGGRKGGKKKKVAKGDLRSAINAAQKSLVPTTSGNKRKESSQT